MKGWIALDIDGTITVDKYSVPSPVVAYIGQLEEAGWKIAIATGRSFVFASLALSDFHFPYVLIVQNGSAVLQMPAKKIVYGRSMSASSIAILDRAFEGVQGNFLVYSGYERGDICYYNPDTFSSQELDYIFRLQLREKESPRPVASFEHLTDCPLIKCFGPREEMNLLAQKLEKTHLFQIASIRDPFEEGGQLLLLTDPLVCKGNALQEILQQQGRGDVVIAAGDDRNDESLLQIADVKIAMSKAPDSLKEQANWIASPAEELGIIPALQWAVQYGA